VKIRVQLIIITVIKFQLKFNLTRFYAKHFNLKASITRFVDLNLLYLRDLGFFFQEFSIIIVHTWLVHQN
jgi:hypothetical protein